MNMALIIVYIIQAGIPVKQFRLALEPEAASIYAKEVLIERTRGNMHQQMPSFEQGTKYIVLDLGGNYKYKNKYFCK